MVFRANESAQSALEQARHHLTKHLTPADAKVASRTLDELVEAHGPIIEGYPVWHDLMTFGGQSREAWDRSVTEPRDGLMFYTEIDHMVMFRDAFLTIPYSDGSTLLDAAHHTKGYRIYAERLDVRLYHPNCHPVLIQMHEPERHNQPRMQLGHAVEIMIHGWKRAQISETWRSFIPYFLGQPHGKRSSLFVNERTGQHMKWIYTAITNAGIFGPPRIPEGVSEQPDIERLLATPPSADDAGDHDNDDQ